MRNLKVHHATWYNTSLCKIWTSPKNILIAKNGKKVTCKTCLKRMKP